MLGEVLAVVGLVAVSTAIGLFWRARSGQPHLVADNEVLTPADVGVLLGARGTVVQFSAATCAYCAPTARHLAQAGAGQGDIAYTELDVDAYPTLVRRLRVQRTPTVLLLDGAGRVVARASGGLRPEQAIALLEACPAPAGAR